MNTLSFDDIFIRNVFVQGQCECLAGFHPLVDPVTHPLRNPSQTCTRDCESEALSRDTTCLKPVPLEAHCFIQKQCPMNSGCYRQVIYQAKMQILEF